MNDNKFRIYISDCKYALDKRNKRMLRFTYGWTLQTPLGPLGERVEGAVAFLSGGKLRWNPPLNYIPGFGGRSGQKQLHSVTPLLYNCILNALNKTKYVVQLTDPVEEARKELNKDVENEEIEVNYEEGE